MTTTAIKDVNKIADSLYLKTKHDREHSDSSSKSKSKSKSKSTSRYSRNGRQPTGYRSMKKTPRLSFKQKEENQTVNEINLEPTKTLEELMTDTDNVTFSIEDVKLDGSELNISIDDLNINEDNINEELSGIGIGLDNLGIGLDETIDLNEYNVLDNMDHTELQNTIDSHTTIDEPEPEPEITSPIKITPPKEETTTIPEPKKEEPLTESKPKHRKVDTSIFESSTNTVVMPKDDFTENDNNSLKQEDKDIHASSLEIGNKSDIESLKNQSLVKSFDELKSNRNLNDLSLKELEEHKKEILNKKLVSENDYNKLIEEKSLKKHNRRMSSKLLQIDVDKLNESSKVSNFDETTLKKSQKKIKRTATIKKIEQQNIKKTVTESKNKFKELEKRRKQMEKEEQKKRELEAKKRLERKKRMEQEKKRKIEQEKQRKIEKEKRLKEERERQIREKFEEKIKFTYELKDLREKAFTIMADENKQINVNSLVNYLKYFGKNNKEIDLNSINEQNVQPFIKYLGSDNQGYLSFSKFVKKIDSDGDVVNAFIRWKKTGNSRVEPTKN